MTRISIFWALLLLPGVATADISDSGDLLLGGQAIIGGTMTVQGNAFSVGGSTFSISEGTVSVGGLLKPSSSGIQWADGSVSTTASTSSSGILASTYTALQSEQTTTATSWDSVVGSTITMTMSGKRALVGFSCQIGTAVLGWCVQLGFLVNGERIDGQSASRGLTRHCSPAANRDEMGGFTHLTNSTYSGSTSFVLQWKGEGTTNRLNVSGLSSCQFWAQEI